MEKLFLDTEFTGLQQKTTLISLALVAETGKAFYAEFTDYDKEQVTDWHADNVLAKLWMNNKEAIETKDDLLYVVGNSATIRAALQQWITQFPFVEIWADVLAYDWVLFCELFGGAFGIPENIFYTPFDLATLFRLKNIIEPISKYDTDVKRFEYAGGIMGTQHIALADARIGLACYKKLMKNE
jgi:3' exoribonuclease, RNase T-like